MGEVEELIKKLKSKRTKTRENAAYQLGKIKDRMVVPALIEVLKDETKTVEWMAAAALRKIGDASAVPVLIGALKDENMHVRFWAAMTLDKVVRECKTIEEAENVEKGIEGSLAALRKERVDKGVLIDAQIKVAKLTREIAEKKDELASKRDLLLDDKPRPPKKGGGMYQEFRKDPQRRPMRT